MRAARLASLLLVLSVAASSAVSATGCATAGDADELGVDISEASVPGKVELSHAADGSYAFRIRTGAGTLLLTSSSYATRLGALGGVLAALDAGEAKESYEVQQDPHGYFSALRGAGGSELATTKVYGTAASAKRAATLARGAIGRYLDAREAATGARFEVMPDAAGQDYFVLFAANGEPVLTSESYSSTAAAYNGAYSLSDGVTLEVAQASDGTFYFTARAANHQVVATSETYATAAKARAGASAAAALIAQVRAL